MSNTIDHIGDDRLGNQRIFSIISRGFIRQRNLPDVVIDANDFVVSLVVAARVGDQWRILNVNADQITANKIRYLDCTVVVRKHTLCVA